MNNLEKVKLIKSLRKQERPDSDKYMFCFYNHMKNPEYAVWRIEHTPGMLDVTILELIDNDVQIKSPGSYISDTTSDMRTELVTWLGLNDTVMAEYEVTTEITATLKYIITHDKEIEPISLTVTDEELQSLADDLQDTIIIGE